MILQEMKKKCSVLYKGFLKRGNETEGRHYQEMMKRYGIEV
jgi:pentatricopeptide repeat protein